MECPKLPPEILSPIATIVGKVLVKRNTIKPLLLISREFYRSLIPFLYECLYLIEEGCDDESPNYHYTVITRGLLPHLHVTFSMNPTLAQYTKTLIISPSTMHDPRTEIICPFLVNLQHLVISSAHACTPSFRQAINSNALTHLNIGCSADRIWLQTLLVLNRQSLVFLSLRHLEHSGAPFDSPRIKLKFPRVTTLHSGRHLLPFINVARFPRLEHLSTQSSFVGPLITANSGVFEHLRTLRVTCISNSVIWSILQSLYRIELLYALLQEMSPSFSEESYLRPLLGIPSTALKYIHMESAQSDKYHNPHIATRLFSKHANLVIIDMELACGDGVARYVRVGDVAGEVIHVHISEPQLFQSWWEVKEVKEDVEEAYTDSETYWNRKKTAIL